MFPKIKESPQNLQPSQNILPSLRRHHLQESRYRQAQRLAIILQTGTSQKICAEHFQTIAARFVGTQHPPSGFERTFDDCELAFVRFELLLQENLTRVPKQQLREIGWSKATDLAKVALREGERFGSATWLHRVQVLPKEIQTREPHRTGNRVVGTLCQVHETQFAFIGLLSVPGKNPVDLARRTRLALRSVQVPPMTLC